LTRFTAFVVVDENEAVNGKGVQRRVVQPVEMPDRWEMGFGSSELLDAQLLAVIADSPAASDERVGKLRRMTAPPPASKAPGFFGKFLGSVPRPHPGSDPSGADRKPESKLHRAAIEKAVAALAKALKEAGERLDAGEVPGAEPIEQARQTLLLALAKSGGTTSFESRLQKFIRSKLVELIAVLSSGSLTSAKPIFHRVQLEFDELARPQNFWETGV
jgi:hypothetical protein